MKQTKIRGQTNTADPWQPAEFEAADIGAIKSLLAGTASDTQQLRVVRWLIRATAVEEMTFRPGGDDGRRASDFAEGKRFVGLQFFSLAKASIPAAPMKGNPA